MRRTNFSTSTAGWGTTRCVTAPCHDFAILLGVRILLAIFAVALVGLTWAIAAAAHHVRQARRSSERIRPSPPVASDEPVLARSIPMPKANGSQSRPLETFF